MVMCVSQGKSQVESAETVSCASSPASSPVPQEHTTSGTTIPGVSTGHSGHPVRC